MKKQHSLGTIMILNSNVASIKKVELVLLNLLFYITDSFSNVSQLFMQNI